MFGLDSQANNKAYTARTFTLLTSCCRSLSTCSELTAELRLFTSNVLSLTLALFGGFYNHASITEEETEVWSSCMSSVNTISKQKSFNLNPSLTDPRVCVHCCFLAYDHGYSYTRKVDLGQKQGTWGIRKICRSPGPGLDHTWQRGAERTHFFFSEPAYGRKGENQNAKELKCLHQTILATQCMVPNQQHKHLRAAGETCKSQVLPRLSQNLHSGRSPGDPRALKNFKGHCSRGFIESSGWEVSRTSPECWLWNQLSL